MAWVKNSNAATPMSTATNNITAAGLHINDAMNTAASNAPTAVAVGKSLPPPTLPLPRGIDPVAEPEDGRCERVT